MCEERTARGANGARREATKRCEHVWDIAQYHEQRRQSVHDQLDIDANINDFLLCFSNVTVRSSPRSFAHSSLSQIHYPTRSGDVAFIDRAVWHQADPITKGTRWAMVIFYEVV